MWLAVILMCTAFVLTGVVVVLLTESQMTHAHHTHRIERR